MTVRVDETLSSSTDTKEGIPDSVRFQPVWHDPIPILYARLDSKPAIAR
jgi:hypothetical protein